MVHRYVASTLGFAIVLIAWLAWRNREHPGQPVKSAAADAGGCDLPGPAGHVDRHAAAEAGDRNGPFAGRTNHAGPAVLVVAGRPTPYASCAARTARRDSLARGISASSYWCARLRWVAGSVPTTRPWHARICLPAWGNGGPGTGRFCNEGFVMWRGLGVNYEFGILEAPARVAIHFTHRLGALSPPALVLLFVTRGVLAQLRRSRPCAAPASAVWLALAMHDYRSAWPRSGSACRWPSQRRITVSQRCCC